MPLTAEHGLLALATARSKNEKIGNCATTYAAQASCPSSCAFFNGGGCYAENGRIYTGVTKPLNGAAAIAAATPVDVALEEAAAIDALAEVAYEISGIRHGRPMRLHTVGDCRTDEAARIVAAAAERYMERGGGPVWTYTHAWRLVDRESWGRVSVLASCETAEQVELARARGYATSIVVDEFADRKLYAIADPPFSPAVVEAAHGDASPPPGGAATPQMRVLPCPAQTRANVTCSSCRLCMNDQGLRDRGYSIGFEIHGTASVVRAARKALAAPSDPERRKTSRDVALAYLEEHGDWPRPVELQRLADISSASAKEMLARLRAEQAQTPRRAAA